MKKADIGLIGLAVMGENLVMNMESKGFTVAVYNRTTEKTDRFIAGRAAGKNIIGCHTLEEFVSQLERPRKVFMMVKAGQAVDDMIEQLLPLLDDYDILIDGGNSHFPDTIRRTAYVESKGKLYIGTGVSGGEEGALKGPSMMPGGSPVAWPYVKPIFQAICAKVEDGSPCCEWVGENGAGHFVKMVHNGIEYGDTGAWMHRRIRCFTLTGPVMAAARPRAPITLNGGNTWSILLTEGLRSLPVPEVSCARLWPRHWQRLAPGSRCWAARRRRCNG